MRKRQTFAALVAATALLVGSFVGAQEAAAGQYRVAIVPSKAQTITKFPMCRIGYTTANSTTVKYYNVQQHTHYQFGYTERGDPVHRIYWNRVVIVNDDGSPAYVGAPSGQYKVYIDGVISSAYSTGIMDAWQWTSAWTNSPVTAWFQDYKTIRIQQTVQIYHPDIWVIAANRVYGMNERYGKCTESTTSPY